MNTQRHMAWWAGAVLAAVLAGCAGDPTTGYSFESLYRTDVKSVAVPMWDIGQEVYRLEEGDSIYYPAHVPHSWRALEGDSIEVIWILTPPSF